MATQIKLRRDTAANWNNSNPTLAAGEPGFETDTGKLKIGTGALAWIELDYVTDVGTNSVNQLVSSQNNNTFSITDTGDVVFSGEVPGGVNRGLVWDYGANINDGVNSIVRQDGNGLTVRAWSEGGVEPFSAPVNIVTNRDADEKTWTFDGIGVLTLPQGGIIAETEITGNPTVVIAPAQPDVESQVLFIKGGVPGYVNSQNGIDIQTISILYEIGDTASFNIWTPENANSTLYWWLEPAGGGDAPITPVSGTVLINEFGASDASIDVEILSIAPFRIYVGPTDGVASTAGISVSVNGEGVGDYHLHLTTGDLSETSVILGTDDHNIRTTVDGGVEINTFLYPEGGGSAKWTFDNSGKLTLPLDGDIVDSNGDSVLGSGGTTLPSQSGQEGKFLRTDGEDLSWVAVTTIPNTKRGWINLVGDKPNNEDDAWFESVVIHGGYAYVLGGDYYINNSGNRSKVYKFDVETGEQVWVKQITAGRLAQFDLSVDAGVVTIDAINTSGVGYKVGEEIVIQGNQINGSEPQNNVTLIVDSIDVDGGVLTASVKPGYNVVGLTGTFTGIDSNYDDARGDACAIAYDEYNQKLVVVTQYESGSGDVVDNFWTWANVYMMNPTTGAIDSTTTISEDGDIYPNSITTHNSAGGIAIVGEKYNEYREFGTLTLSATYDGYFDILKTELDAEHYPGAPFNDYQDFWITGTGITGQTQVNNVNYYENLSPTTREGSGTVTAEIVAPSPITFSLQDFTDTTLLDSANVTKNSDNFVTDGSPSGCWLTIATGTLATSITIVYTPGSIIPITWGAGSTTTDGYALVYFNGDGTIQFTACDSGGTPVAGTWYFPAELAGGSSLSVTVTAGGTNYRTGHKLKLLGTDIPGGATPDNDIILTVTGVDGSGTITSATAEGTLPGSNVTTSTFTNYNVGSGATFTVSVNPATGAFTLNGLTGQGSNYVVGDVLIIPGTSFAGGTSPTNNATLVVSDADVFGLIGNIVNYAATGTGPTNAIRVFVNGVDFTVEGTWSMRQNLGGEAFIWTPTWSNAIGGPSGDRFMDVCWEDAGTALYAVGRGQYEVAYTQALVVKFNDSTGAVMWSKDIKFSEAGSNNREARAVCLVPGSTDILVAGAWYNSANNGGNDEIILTRMTDAGETVWQKTYSPNAEGTTFSPDWEISLKPTSDNIVVSFEQITNNSRGLAYMIVDPSGTVVRHRVVSSDGNSNYNYYDTPTANFADIYTDENLDQYIVMAGYTYVPSDNYQNALLMKLPLDGLKDIAIGEKWSIGEHIMTRHDISVTTVTSAFDSFIPTEHEDTMTNSLDARNYTTRTPDGLLNVWKYQITDDEAGYLEFGDGSKQSFATNIIPQIPAANAYWLTDQDSGKHIFFEHENGTVYIPHSSVRYFPVGFTFTIVNTTGSDCWLDSQGGEWVQSIFKLAGRNLTATEGTAIGIPDSGSGSMVTVMKIKDGYTMTNSDNDNTYPDVWIVSGPGDLYLD
jgi:Major tropism determinant N-terminal domain